MLQLGDTGLEPLSTTVHANKELRESAPQGGAESGAVGAQTPPIDPDLQAVVKAWPGLPESVRAGIVAMVRAAVPEDGRRA